jgi:hypothetical protein
VCSTWRGNWKMMTVMILSGERGYGMDWSWEFAFCIHGGNEPAIRLAYTIIIDDCHLPVIPQDGNYIRTYSESL